MRMSELETAVRQWHRDRGLLDVDEKAQFIALVEEVAELGNAINIGTRDEVVDAVGDIMVILTNITARRAVPLRDCYQAAYDEIRHRTGQMVDGRFVKDAA